MSGYSFTQGKCTTCKVRWIWKGKPLLKHARCPDCGRDLERTTTYLQWPAREMGADAQTRANKLPVRSLADVKPKAFAATLSAILKRGTP